MKYILSVFLKNPLYWKKFEYIQLPPPTQQRMKFRAFRRKTNNLYYFQFLSEEDQVRLNSPSYADKDLCFNGIRQAINSSAKIKNYKKRTDEKGKHFFILSTSKGLEIGRSIKYKSEKEIELAIAQFMAEAPKAATREPEKSSTPEAPKPTTTPAKEKKGRVYLAQNQPYLCNNLTYDTFQSEGNQKYYFVFKDEDDNAILINGNVRGFKTIEDLDNGIKAVLEFATKKKNYDKRVAKNGRHYFLIKNDEDKSVAKSAHFYSLKKDMNAAVKLVQCAGIEVAKPTQQLFSDNYLPIAAYAGAEGFHTFQDEKSGEYYFAFNNAEGKTFLRSEGYKSANSRDNGIQAVIKNGPNEKSWNTFFKNKRHFYALKAANHQEIARSDYYKEEASMLEDFNLVKGKNSPIGVGSAVVGGALMSALMIKQRKEESEAKRKAEKEAKKQAEEAKLAAFAAANLKAEEAAKQKTEAERLKAAEEAKLAAEAEEVAKSAAEEDRKKEAAATAAAAAMALAAKGNTSSTTSSTSSKSTSGSGWPGWLIPLIIALLLIILALMYFKGCDGCNPPVTPVVDPVTTIDTVQQDTTPFGKGGEALGFIPGSMEFMMADHLSAYDSSFPRTFTAEDIAFAKNKIRLNTKAKKQLDNLAVLLKEYPKAKIEIYGYVAANEKTFYKGNKEVSLDDVRAREVFNYLKSNGIEESRMEFYGNGLDDKAGIKIKLISRGVTR